MLETTRLTLIPLTRSQLERYLRPGQDLEKSLGLKLQQRTVPAALRQAFHQNIIPALDDAGDYKLFFTLWIMVEKEKRVLVGELHCKGSPNERGEVEIGYSIYEQFRNQGYMSEAISTFLGWAFPYSSVKAVVAETDRQNEASHRILEKAGFSISRESALFYWWRLTRNTFSGAP